MILVDSTEQSVIVKYIQCTLVGTKFRIEGQDWIGTVKSTKLVGTQLLCYFEENDFICDNRTLRLLKGEN